MKYFQNVIGIGLCAAFVAACGGSPADVTGATGSSLRALPAQSSMTKTGTATVTQLYSFRGKTGRLPYAGLTAVNGMLYGTTSQGGGKGGGAVFQITPAGTLTLLHAFAGGADGQYPYASLNDVDGVLYGTTEDGGAADLGTVFKITTSGTETVLYSFKGGKDGANPVARLTDVGGVLYGTTRSGGAHSYGTVFQVTKSGKETVIHSFKSGADGAVPRARLTNVGGKLYGTTSTGGEANDGTVFDVTTSGKERVLYSFKGTPNDGANPAAGLIDVNGTLYGTTSLGGHACYGYGSCGTVFKVTTAGLETVLHTFAGGSDGALPYASLADVNGALYGTTTAGGRGCYYGAGCGIVFKITPSGTESVVAFFGNDAGTTPYAHVTAMGGTLYGTTSRGGALNVGTVFALTP
jgi:uncharacterized repeat protein (TIGR03803 family)